MFEVNNDILTLLKQKLQNNFKEDLLSYEFQYDMPVFVFKKEELIEIISFLKNDEELAFSFLTTLCGMHYPDSAQPFGVVYHLHSFKNNLRIRLKFFTDVLDPVFPTITQLFNAANWMERETWDFFGIRFDGHPNLKRILNVDEMTDFPLRREFPLEDQTREDKNDKMFGR